MAIYNIASHTIEAPDGTPLAHLTPAVSTAAAYRIAENWDASPPSHVDRNVRREEETLVIEPH